MYKYQKLSSIRSMARNITQRPPLIQMIQFVAKLSKMNDRYYIGIPSDLAHQAEKLRGKYLNITISETFPK